ncbi:MAG: adenylosuccinate lyase [Elusimicrobia bacterium]|nr:adenylosuccinate lyase [Elusimicrobiota bacterium]
MIERYSLAEMAGVWTDESRFRKMLDVEIIVCEALCKLGEIPPASLQVIKKKADFNVRRINEIEKTVKHDIIAFLTNIAENVGKDSVYIHKGLTSSDVLDTALALQLMDASDILINDLIILSKTIKKQAARYKNTLMIGRTHGVHAEPITLGFKLAGWYTEIMRDIERLKMAKENISYGKISGAVGTYAHSPIEVEKYVMEKLKLKPEPASTQVVPRDRHAQYLTTLAIIAASLERFALEIRSLQRTEIGELGEPFTKGQKGSSAMPHKKNPITCEQMCGLARVFRANAMASLENIALWNERDISHSSVERVIIPDSTILLNYMLKKMNNIIKDMVVNPKKMIENIKITESGIFSQRVLLAIVKKGIAREKAYPVVQKLSQSGFKNKKPLEKFLTKKEIEECFDVNYYTRNIKEILKRVGII